DLARTYHREMVPLLREHGASEFVPRPGLITLCRIRREYSTPIFFKDTNGYNHHTISEFLAVSYAGNGALTSTELRFPDLQHVRLTRRDPADGKLRETNIDLAAILEAKERARDLPVEWGDVIEIPELDHREAENWGGFSGADIANVESILT